MRRCRSRTGGGRPSRRRAGVGKPALARSARSWSTVALIAVPFRLPWRCVEGVAGSGSVGWIGAHANRWGGSAAVGWVLGAEEGVDDGPAESVGGGDGYYAGAGVLGQPGQGCLGGAEEVDLVAEGRADRAAVVGGDERDDRGGRGDAGHAIGCDLHPDELPGGV